MYRKYVNYLFGTFLLLQGAFALGADWPMWKHNSGRTAVSPDALPAQLHLQWVRELPPARQAWRDKSNSMIFFDASYEPIVAGKLMFVGSMNSDSVTAYSTETGAEKWRFYTDGPVRFAPVAYKGKLYVGSDDGYLYCLDASTGKLVWKKRGGPSDDKILGNERLIGMWPLRGAPVIHHDVLYCAAGIWPFMGTFIYALNPETGDVIWANSGNGARWITQPHNAPSFAGVAPQGYLAASGETLLIPSGRSNPGAFNIETGAFLYNDAASRSYGKDAGGYAVSVAGNTFACRPALYALDTGKGLGKVDKGVITDTAYYAVEGDALKITPLNGGKEQSPGKIPQEVGRAYIKAGDVLYCARNDGTLSAVSIADVKAPSVIWQGKIEGKAWNMLAADDKLFVVNRAGSIFCFGAAKGETVKHAASTRALPSPSGRGSALFNAVLKSCKDTRGYCVVLGADQDLVAELAARTTFHVIVVDPRPQAVADLRKKLDNAGVYGSRVSAVVAEPFRSGLPPYLASALIVTSQQKLNEGKLAAMFKVLRPYGGVAVLSGNAKAVETLAKAAKLQKAQISQTGDLCILKRDGALPGSASWSHQYADAGNSVVSKDQLVKPPFGLLWFGGPANDSVLPRHGHGPNPHVAGGRIFIEGANMLRALDVYTGRLLWERKLEGVGHYYDNTSHHPGANNIGSNYASLEDAVYILYTQKCLKLDAATGATIKEFALPAGKDGKLPFFGSIRVEGDFLVLTALPLNISTKTEPIITPNVPYSSVSRTLAVLDRHSGELLWSREAAHGFRHNSVIAAGDMVYCLDKLSPTKEAALARRGQLPPKTTSLLALNIKSGDVVWQSNEDVFGTWLGYSGEHDVLIQGGSAFRDRARDEVGIGIVSYRGRDGKVLWKNLEYKYGGPLMLRHGEIILNGDGGGALDLLTGKPSDWTWRRFYGCNTAIGGEHVLTFRSGAAGYYDVARKGGTGNLGGFKSGCTSNLIPGDGILAAPDYTRTCTCSYQNQTSLALRHMPEAEMWTFSPMETPGRMGINFGAPGDRLSDSGTLWTEYPLAARSALRRKVKSDGTPFRHHSALFSGKHESWIGASGIENMKNVSLVVPEKGTYTVRLYFAEPDRNAKQGSRVFSVALGGQDVLSNFDIVKEAGAARTVAVKELKGIQLDSNLELSFAANKGEPLICGVEIISTPATQ